MNDSVMGKTAFKYKKKKKKVNKGQLCCHNPWSSQQRM